MYTVFEELASENAQNCRCWQPRYRLTPLSRELPEFPHKPYIFRNIESLGYILQLIVWVYLHSNFRDGLWKTHVLCNTVHNGHSWSSKVVVFGTNRKGVCDFLLVINCNLGPILHRFWNRRLTDWKLHFFLPHSFNALARWTLSSFWMIFLSSRL